MSSSAVLVDRDINTSANSTTANPDIKPVAEVKSMEYHRQVLQNKLDENQYVLEFFI